MIPKTIDICGIPYAVEECKDNFTTDTHFGEIRYAEAVIAINQDMPDAMKMQTLVHEWLHGALVMNGYNTETQNEQLVSSLAAAINQTFQIKQKEAKQDAVD